MEIPDCPESFMMTCKEIRQVCIRKDMLKEHNWLRRSYRDFQYHNRVRHRSLGSWELKLQNQSPSTENPMSKMALAKAKEGFLVSRDRYLCSTPLHLLFQISEQPLIAAYIVTADLTTNSSGNTKEAREEHVNQFRKSKALERLLKKSPYLKALNAHPRDVLHYMFSMFINYTDTTMASALLLTLLPNAVKISLPYTESGAFPSASFPPFQLKSLLDLLAIKANASPASTASLAHLTTIRPSNIEWCPQLLSSYEQYLSITSVRNWTAYNTRPDYANQFLDGPLNPNFCSNIENFELGHSGIDNEILGKLFSKMPRLRAFTWIFAGDVAVVDCENMMSAIGQGAGDKLEELTFMFKPTQRVIPRREVRSMKMFTKLKFFKTDVRAFLGDLDDDLNNKVPRYITATPVLSQILPSTIENITLLVERPHHFVSDMLTFLSEMNTPQPTTLPNIKGILVCNIGSLKLSSRDCPHHKEQENIPDLVGMSEEKKADVRRLYALKKTIVVHQYRKPVPTVPRLIRS